ncbi:LLM class flavin-dependent oxidoreductase [Sporichthya brevicatena]|uniref:LLM class flavin-dependent oxidoreductase n=1 Tax=Sporichthya brevicatena TaxID=171442 RepID=A0ABN1G3X1_9ACTN
MKIAPLFLAPTPDPTKSFVERYEEIYRLVEYANEAQMECVWFTEHHFSDYGYSPNPLMMMAEAARRAPDIRLGAAVAVLPLWHPVRLAEDIAFLDCVSGGRVDIGIGRGYQPLEFAVFGADLANNRGMFAESLKIMKKCWTEDDWSFEGKHWQIPETTVFPRPVQNPIPFWMAATTPPSIRGAVEMGYHLCTGTGALLDELEQRNAFIDACFDELGRSSEGIHRSVNKFILCTNDPSEVDLAIRESKWQIRVSRDLTSGTNPPGGRNPAPPFKGEPNDEIWKQRLIVGTPEECLEIIRAHAEVGISYINALFDFGGVPHDVVQRSMKLFTEELMPEMESIKPRVSTPEERAANAEVFVNRGDRYTGV